MSSAPTSRNSPISKDTRTRRCECSASARKPPRASSSAPAPSGATGLTPLTRATRSADPNATNAITANTASTPETVSSTPAIMLATRTPPFSTQLETTLVAVSSSADRAREGTITACAGRVMVTAVDATTAPA